MAKFLETAELHSLVVKAGHSFWPDRLIDPELTDVWPSPKIIVTVALGQDNTLETAYRDRYFTCMLDHDENPVLPHKPEFTLQSPLSSLVGVAQGPGAFLFGPVHWLLFRVQRFQNLWLWPMSKYRQANGSWFFQSWEFSEVSRLVRRLSNIAAGSSPTVAITLNLLDPEDCRILLEIASFVGSSYHNFYLSDESGAEVYLLHHHDKVLASIPGDAARYECVRQLMENSDAFVDCSGYVASSTDGS